MSQTRALFGSQMAMKNIHSGRALWVQLVDLFSCGALQMSWYLGNFCFSPSEMYSLLLETYIKDSRETYIMKVITQKHGIKGTDALWVWNWNSIWARIEDCLVYQPCRWPNIPLAVMQGWCALTPQNWLQGF